MTTTRRRGREEGRRLLRRVLSLASWSEDEGARRQAQEVVEELARGLLDLHERGALPAEGDRLVALLAGRAGRTTGLMAALDR